MVKRRGSGLSQTRPLLLGSQFKAHDVGKEKLTTFSKYNYIMTVRNRRNGSKPKLPARTTRMPLALCKTKNLVLARDNDYVIFL